MASSMVRAVLLGTFCLGIAAVEVTPLQKVTKLLQDLSAKVAAEGKNDAAQYDKFACFCKEQATEKQRNIEKSTATIARLKAEQADLSGNIAGLQGDVSGLNKAISATEKKNEADTEKREKAHDQYLRQATDLDEAVTDCETSVANFKEALGSQGEEQSLLQVEKTRALLEKHPAAATVTALLSKAPNGYAGTNAIIHIIQGLQAKFKKQAHELDLDEGNEQSMFDRSHLAGVRQNQFRQKEADDKEQAINTKDDNLQRSKTNSDDETKDLEADQKFLKELTNQCEEKAKLFDQRSSTRSNELSAMNQAIETLSDINTGGKGTVGKMAEIQAPKAVSFLQIHRDSAKKEVALKAARALLLESDSTTLSTLAARFQVAGDHFVKVRGIIKDLVSKLKADADAEASQKLFCDKEMKKAVSNRDRSMMELEAAGAKITSLTAEKNDLTASINSLTSAVAENMKALNEATELRATERANNEDTIQLASQAKESVKSALTVLSKFYKGQSFVQTQAQKYTPPNADREGKTVKDRAGEVFQSEYKGAQKEATGILGILEVTLSDFERVEKKTTRDEADQQEEFAGFKKNVQEDNKDKRKNIKDKEDAKAEAEDNLLSAKDDKSESQKLRSQALDGLAGLQASCVEGTDVNYQERVAARKAEIESLKEATKILDDWQK